MEKEYCLGDKVENEILMDAINPIGSISLLQGQLEQVISRYLSKKKNKICLADPWRGCPMDLRLLQEGTLARGQAYQITLSVQEIYDYPKQK